MREYVGRKMIADHADIGGGIYFYEESFAWKPRHYRFNSQAFEIRYADIEDVNVVETRKKRINIKANGQIYFVDLYKVDHFLFFLDQAIKEAKQGVTSKPILTSLTKEPKEEAPAPKKEDGDITEKILEVAKLRDEGLITEEEFQAIKARLIGM